MGIDGESEVSRLVESLQTGDRSSLNELMPAVYNHLRQLAMRYMTRERSGHPLQPSALVHEAYLRMTGQRTVDWHDRAQLLGIAAQMMRRVLLDHSAAVHSAKRGRSLVRINLAQGGRR